MNKSDIKTLIILLFWFIFYVLCVFNNKLFNFKNKKNSKQVLIENDENTTFSRSLYQNNNADFFLNEKPNPFKTCSRYVVAEHDDFGGLGHTFGAVVFALNLAMEFNFDLVLHENLWRHYSGQNENYGNFKSMLNLENLLSFSDFSENVGKYFKTYFIKDRQDFFNLMKELKEEQMCNITIHVSMGLRSSCNNKCCFLNWPGAYQRSKSFFKKNYEFQNLKLKKNNLILYHEHIENKKMIVGWHIRCGDIVITRNERFFININKLFLNSNVSTQHFFFSERVCSEFDFLKSIFVNAVFVTLKIEETVLYLQNSDVLIHTGSSLPQTLYLTGPQNGLFFESQPKELEKGAIETYHLLSAINFNLDGNVEALLPGQCNHDSCVEHYIQNLYETKYGEQQSNLDIHKDLRENYIVQELNNLNYEFCLNLVKETLQKQGIWIVKLLYNNSDLHLPVDVFRYQMHVELIDIEQQHFITDYNKI